MARYEHAMLPTLSTLELDILRKLVNGEAVSLSSQLRIRLELAGAIREGARGITVTVIGRRLARQEPAIVAADGPPPGPKVARDGRGRRKPFQRRSVF
jgi:hypothetical protein